MKCKHMPEQLVSLLYNELDREEARQIKDHLKTCAECRQAYEDLKCTTGLLEQWEDAAPKRQWVFMHEPASRWAAWKTGFRNLGWGKRFALGVPALAGLALILLALLNFRADYENGRWSVAFSLRPEPQTEIDQAQIVEALGQMQTETLRLVSQMIDESEYRQQQQTQTDLIRWTSELQNQRRQDLRILGQGLEGLHQTTEGRYTQTQNVLSDLIQLTGYKVERQR